MLSKFPRTVPMSVFIGAIIFGALLIGGYFVGSTHAVSSQPIYITDGTGSNAANVNAHGHLSVHIADGGLPAFTGPLNSRHMSFPLRPGLRPGACYAAYIRGGGSFEDAAVSFRGGGAGRPDVLIRIDQNPVWVENGRSNSSPVSPAGGVSRSGSTLVFGYSYSLSFKAFAGVLLCWHGSGVSDPFEVQMTIANGGGGPYLPEEMRVSRSGDSFTWRKLQGPTTLTGYELFGTDSSIVTGIHIHHPPAALVPFVLHTQQYSESIPGFAYPRFFIFEMQPSGDPTRVGPFGSWSGE